MLDVRYPYCGAFNKLLTLSIIGFGYLCQGGYVFTCVCLLTGLL